MAQNAEAGPSRLGYVARWPLTTEYRFCLDPFEVSSSGLKWDLRDINSITQRLVDAPDATHMLLDAAVPVTSAELAVYRLFGKHVVSFEWALDSYQQRATKPEAEYAIVGTEPSDAPEELAKEEAKEEARLEVGLAPPVAQEAEGEAEVEPEPAQPGPSQQEAHPEPGSPSEPDQADEMERSDEVEARPPRSKVLDALDAAMYPQAGEASGSGGGRNHRASVASEDMEEEDAEHVGAREDGADESSDEDAPAASSPVKAKRRRSSAAAGSAQKKIKKQKPPKKEDPSIVLPEEQAVLTAIDERRKALDDLIAVDGPEAAKWVSRLQPENARTFPDGHGGRIDLTTLVKGFDIYDGVLDFHHAGAPKFKRDEGVVTSKAKDWSRREMYTLVRIFSRARGDSDEAMRMQWQVAEQMTTVALPFRRSGAVDGKFRRLGSDNKPGTWMTLAIERMRAKYPDLQPLPIPYLRIGEPLTKEENHKIADIYVSDFDLDETMSFIHEALEVLDHTRHYYDIYTPWLKILQATRTKDTIPAVHPLTIAAVAKKGKTPEQRLVAERQELERAVFDDDSSDEESDSEEVADVLALSESSRKKRKIR